MPAASASGRNEPAMIAAILAGDNALFHELIRPYERSVYWMALSHMKNESDAEDVAQEAFLRAFRSLASFRAESKFSTWLITITLNEARSRLRKSGRVRIESIDIDPDDDDTPAQPAVLRDWREVPSESLERLEIKAMIQAALGELPLIYREVFVLRDMEELSVNEAAEALNISVPAVKVRLHRARLMLQKQLAPQLAAANPNKSAGIFNTGRRWFPW